MVFVTTNQKRFKANSIPILAFNAVSAWSEMKSINSRKMMKRISSNHQHEIQKIEINRQKPPPKASRII